MISHRSHKLRKFIANYSVKITDMTGMEDANKLFDEQVSISKQHETKICFFHFPFLSDVFASIASKLFIPQYLIKQFNFTVLHSI